MDVDQLVEIAVAKGELDDGKPIDWIMTNTNVPVSILVSGSVRDIKYGSAEWTERELQFLKEQNGHMALEDIAAHLGRTPVAVKLKRVRSGLPAPTKIPGYLIADRVAFILGCERHLPPALIDMGIMPGELVPGIRGIRRILVVGFVEWITTPKNWVYIDLKKVTDRRYARMIEDAQAGWGDEWLTTRQAADLYNELHAGATLIPKDVYRRAVQLGKISYVRAVNLGGRNRNPGWSMVFVRRSEVEKMSIKQRGHR